MTNILSPTREREKEFRFDDYEVIVCRNNLKFVFFKKDKNGVREKDTTGSFVKTVYLIESGTGCNFIGEQEDGFKIQIELGGNYGNKFVFVHFDPAPLQQMFDFILRGYKLEKYL